MADTIKVSEVVVEDNTSKYPKRLTWPNGASMVVKDQAEEDQAMMKVMAPGVPVSAPEPGAVVPALSYPLTMTYPDGTTAVVRHAAHHAELQKLSTAPVHEVIMPATTLVTATAKMAVPDVPYVTATAKADNTHDGRYTHTSFASPGGPGGPRTAPTPYPKWVKPEGGKPVIVNDPSEEAVVMATHPKVQTQKGFNRVGLMLATAVMALLMIAVPQAVTILTTTTLSAAVPMPAQGAQANTIRVASITGITTSSFLFVDGEEMDVTSVGATATTPLGVIRGVGGTTPGSHASGATVTIGPGDAFHDGAPPAGACVAANQIYSPWIDVRTGNFWVCRLAGTWNGTNIRPLTYNSVQAGAQ
jgi:hypothetical protein